ncbi:unnamed protein product [Dicrocoelium dendriticum]|nr:unnamed protein product [Dicrocoelium dendriticum]
MITDWNELSNGYEIPNLFYGTYKVLDEILPCLDSALGAGYRGIDTAAYYHNERRIGEALKILRPKYNLERKDIFLSTKLPPKSYGITAAVNSFRLSQEALETPYIDLYMIHWPGLQGFSPTKLERQGHMADIRKGTWKALEELVIQDKTLAQQLEDTNLSPSTTVTGSGAYRAIRSLGICNYLPRHIHELSGYASIPPAVVQYEFHPYLSVSAQEHPMRRICTRLFPMQAVHFQARTIFADGSPELLSSPILQAISNELGRTPAQILIRWSLQKGHSVVARSTKPRHIIENSRVFEWELSPAAMSSIDGMERNQRFCWDPNTVP